MTERKTMSTVRPFKATYYNQKKIRTLTNVVCPPYDVISAEYERTLKKRSAYNYVNIILRDENTTYQDLARRLNDWLAAGVLVDDPDEAFYLVEQEYTVNGKKFCRRGFLGAIKLTGDHAIHAHEKTHAKPKVDRLKVIKAVKANLSPSFIIYPKNKQEPVQLLLKRMRRQKPFASVYDGNEKTTYRMWKVSAPADIERIVSYFDGLPLMIADGHHRTEVARAYYEMQKGKKNPALNYMMAYFSPIDSDLTVFPTHRVYTHAVDIDALISEAGKLFSVNRCKNAVEAAEFVGKQKKFAFAACQRGRCTAFVLKDKSSLDNVFRSKEDKPYRQIDSFLLHHLVFDKIIGIHPKEGELLYTIDPRKAVALAKEHDGCAFIIKATSIQEIMDVSVKGLTMPQKTTYFYPKFLSGLLLRRHAVDKQK